MTFQDAKGEQWTIVLKTETIETIRLTCKDKAGAPVDLLAVIEAGHIGQLLGDIRLLIDVCFIACLPQIKERFDVQTYSQEFSHLADLIPGFENETWTQKAGRWFGSRIDGAALLQLTEAFQEAVVNFIPSQSRQKAIRAILDKEKELERIAAERVIARAEQMTPEITKRIEQEVDKTIAKFQDETLGG